MKRQIVIVITAMFVGAMLFGSSVQAQAPTTTEERLQKLESVVNGDTSTVTARTIRTAASGPRLEINPAPFGTQISWIGWGNAVESYVQGSADIGLRLSTANTALQLLGGRALLDGDLSIGKGGGGDSLFQHGGVRLVARGGRLIARFGEQSKVIANFSN